MLLLKHAVRMHVRIQNTTVPDSIKEAAGMDGDARPLEKVQSVEELGYRRTEALSNDAKLIFG
jgi:hypothetical protein